MKHKISISFIEIHRGQVTVENIIDWINWIKMVKFPKKRPT